MRLVRRAPRQPRRSREFHHRLLTACGETQAAQFSRWGLERRCIPPEPPPHRENWRFAALCVAFRSKYTRYSSFARLVSQAPRPSRRSPGFHHRLLTLVNATLALNRMEGRFQPSVRVINLLNQEVQNHIFGDVGAAADHRRAALPVLIRARWIRQRAAVSGARSTQDTATSRGSTEPTVRQLRTNVPARPRCAGAQPGRLPLAPSIRRFPRVSGRGGRRRLPRRSCGSCRRSTCS